MIIEVWPLCRLPDLYRFIVTCRGDTCTIGRPCYRGCPCSMFLMSIEAGTVSSIPYLDGRIITGGGETAAVGGPGNISYALAVPTVGKQDPPGGRIENLCRGV